MCALAGIGTIIGLYLTVVISAGRFMRMFVVGIKVCRRLAPSMCLSVCLFFAGAALLLLRFLAWNGSDRVLYVIQRDIMYDDLRDCSELFDRCMVRRVCWRGKLCRRMRVHSLTPPASTPTHSNTGRVPRPHAQRTAA